MDRHGQWNHWQGAVTWLRAMRVQTVCDVGGGRGDFAAWMLSAGTRVAWSVDVGRLPSRQNLNHGVRGLLAPAHAIPLADGAAEMVTAFDMLEHALAEDVAEILVEFARVAWRWMVFSICTDVGPDRPGIGQLHPTVRPLSWWRDKIERHAGMKTTCRGRYVVAERWG